MKHLIIPIFVVSFLSFAAHGQAYYVDLSKHTLTLPGRNFYIAQVVDARPVKGHIGIVQRGITNTKTPATFKQDFPRELTGLFTRTLPQQPNQQAIILKVLKLKIAELTKATAEIATVEVVVEFIAPQADSYRLLYRASSVVNSKGLEVTGRHNDNITAALQDCLEQFQESDQEALQRNASVLTWEQVEAPFALTGQALDYPMLQAEAPKRGIYQSFLEFRNNTPSLTPAFEVVTKPRSGKDWQGMQDVTPYLSQPDGSRKPVKRVWGFSDGNEVYIYFQKEFFPLERRENLYTFYGYAAPDAGSVAAASVLGGAIGGAIAAAATSGKKAAFVLDVLTGQVSEYDPNGYEGRVAGRGTAKITLYCREASNIEQPVQIILKSRTDSLVTKLAANSLAELEWDDTTEEISVCVIGQEQPCFTFLPKVDQVNYFEYAPKAQEKGQIAIRSVKEPEAAFYLKKIRYAQEMEEKRKRK